MENYGYHMIGEILVGLGRKLQDPDSDIRKRFRLSREQMSTLIGVIRLAASPDVQKKYMYNLVHRWGKSERTIREWISLGLVREGHKNAHDTRLYWYSDELDQDELTLIRFGYLKPKKHHRLRYFIDMLNGFLK